MFWVGSAKKDLQSLPAEIQLAFGHQLWLVQNGDTPDNAKALKGNKGASVLELVEDFNKGSYRAVYTVRFSDAVYVLHAFEKKSKQGIGHPPKDQALIESRLKAAEAHHKARSQGGS